jgi:hypothetical protein
MSSELPSSLRTRTEFVARTVDNSNATISYIYEKFLVEQDKGGINPTTSMSHLLTEIYNGQQSTPDAQDVATAIIALDNLVHVVTGIDKISSKNRKDIIGGALFKTSTAKFDVPPLVHIVNNCQFDIRSIVVCALTKVPINLQRLWNATSRQHTTVYTQPIRTTPITQKADEASAVGQQLLPKMEYKQKSDTMPSTFNVQSVDSGSFIQHTTQPNGQVKLSLASSKFTTLLIRCDVQHTSTLRSHNGKDYGVSHCIGAVNLSLDADLSRTSYLTHTSGTLSQTRDFAGNVSFMESGAVYNGNIAIMHTFHLSSKPVDKSALLLPVVDLITHLTSTVAMQIRSICSRFRNIMKDGNPTGAFNVEPDVSLVYGNKWPLAMDNTIPLAIDRVLAVILEEERIYNILPNNATRMAVRPVFSDSTPQRNSDGSIQLTSYFADLQSELRNSDKQYAKQAYDLLFGTNGCIELLGAALCIRNSLSASNNPNAMNLTQAITPIMLSRDRASTCIQKVISTYGSNSSQNLQAVSIAQQAHDSFLM